MPPTPELEREQPQIPDDSLRVLLTGFGPFAQFEENPSWLAVKPLHNTIIPPLEPSASEDQILSDGTQTRPRPIHISALQIPVIYDSVLKIVPPLHTNPPRVPDPQHAVPDEPGNAYYDFIFHVGVAGRGPLRMERVGHKTGYLMKDVNGDLAPLVPAQRTDDSQRYDVDRSGLMIADNQFESVSRPTRGFGGPKFENYAEDLQTEIDVSRLVQDLKRSGIEQIYTSMDAGHYLCDFTYFCSLAEARRHMQPYEKRRITQVLFLHCPPVDQPLSTEEVTEAIKRIIVWVCQAIESIDAALEAEAREDEAEA